MTLDLTTAAKAPAAPVAAIAAGRFMLRPVRKSDAGLFRALCGRPPGGRGDTRSIPHPLPPGAAEAFVARMIAGSSAETAWVMDGVCGRACQRCWASSSLKAMDRGQSEIGYWVAPAFWNAGFASEAVRALIAANPLGSRTIFAEVFQDNPGSARVLTNCGFEYIGDAESFSVARNARVPTWTYLKKLD